MAVQPARLCIISREPLRSGHFIAALQALLGPQDLLEIIIDRRHGGSSGEADLTEDRRRQRQVALGLEANGYAIVPASVDPTEDRTWRPRPSLFRLELPPIERSSPVDDEDEEFESIRSFQRPRPRTLIPKLIGVLIGVTLIALVLLLAGQFSGQSRLSRLLTDPLRGGPERPPGQPVVAETPPPARPDSESPSAGGTASTSPVSPRDADRLTPRPPETNSPSEVTGTTARPSPSAPPRSNRVAGVPPSEGTTSKATSKQVAASPLAELVGEPVSRGWGDSYAVRLLDPAGRPMVGANVVLLARMADGTVENVAMGALSEPGTYRGTVPTSRSTPVDLRVRVTTGDGPVEVSVPVKP